MKIRLRRLRQKIKMIVRGRKLEKRKGVEENKIEKRGRNMRKWYQTQLETKGSHKPG